MFEKRGSSPTVRRPLRQSDKRPPSRLGYGREHIMAEPKKKKIRWSAAWGDARDLIWTHRRRLLLGAVLMLINQAMGLVLPASTKFLIDQVIVKGRVDLLWKIEIGR